MSKAKVHHPPRGSSKASLVQNQWRTLHHRALRARRPRPPCRTLQTPQVTSYHRTRSANRGHCLLTARCGCKVGACKCLKPVSQKVANYFLCWKNFVRLAWREASSASRQSASLRLLTPAVPTRMMALYDDQQHIIIWRPSYHLFHQTSAQFTPGLVIESYSGQESYRATKALRS